ncbi:hypothetical protein D9757_004779 [Collybiopsis confluens]|uniref:Uncharacterized protein n=1 Tax=Collybiopsis confluens TaxID=2823264 RepID=A0A8H5HSF9_9AGAR|nr:hypothetical protein D9757_004779 [Collybiopsis confluens]
MFLSKGHSLCPADITPIQPSSRIFEHSNKDNQPQVLNAPNVEANLPEHIERSILKSTSPSPAGTYFQLSTTDAFSNLHNFVVLSNFQAKPLEQFPNESISNTTIQSPDVGSDSEKQESEGNAQTPDSTPQTSVSRQNPEISSNSSSSPNASPFVMYAPPYYDRNKYGRGHLSSSMVTSPFYPPSTFAAPTWSTFTPAPTSNSPPANPDVTRCQHHFFLGYCALGMTCPFRHSLTSEEAAQLGAALVSTSQNPLTVSRENNSQQTFILSPPSALEPAKRECKFWMKANSCTFGDKCLFLHTSIDTSAPDRDDDSSESASKSYLVDSEVPSSSSASGWEVDNSSAANWGSDQNWSDWGNTGTSWGDDLTTTLSTTNVGSWNDRADSKKRNGGKDVKKKGGREDSSTRGGEHRDLDRRKNVPTTHSKDNKKSRDSRPQESSANPGAETVSADTPEDHNFSPNGFDSTDSGQVIDESQPNVNSVDFNRNEDEDDANTVVYAAVDPEDSSFLVTETEESEGVEMEEGSINQPNVVDEPTASGKPVDELGEGEMQGSIYEQWGEEEAIEPSWGWSKTDDSWTNPQRDQWDQPEAKDSRPRKTLLCKAFGQGHCPYGDDCYYLHVTLEEETSSQGASHTSEQETLPVDESPNVVVETELPTLPLITRQHFFCDVTYGQDALPEEILTAFESDTIFLSNLPLSFTEDEVTTIFSNFGSIQETEVQFPGNSCRIRVKFSSHRDAAEAMTRLHGSDTILNPMVEVRLDSKALITHESDPSPPQTSIKFSYANPTCLAWVFYESMDLYKKAEALNGEIFKGRKIKVIRPQRPSKKQNYFSLRVEGLPVTTEKLELKGFFKGCAVVEITHPTYTSAPDAELECLLRRCGELTDFVMDLSPPSEKPRAVNFARFSDAAAVSRAVETLNNSEQDFLGGGRVSVQCSYYTVYMISLPKMSAIRPDFDLLQDRYTNDSVRLTSGTTSTDDAELRISGSDAIPFLKARKELNVLISGETILDDEGRPLWDDYFDLPSSNKKLEEINKGRTGSNIFFIERDFRSRNVLVFGNESGRGKGKEVIRDLLALVQKSVFVAGVSDGGMGAMIRAGYHLEASNRLHFDFASRTMIVRGKVDDFERPWAMISKFESEAVLPCSEQACGLCFSDTAVEPILLSCQHMFCKGCVELWFKSLIGPNFVPFKCIAAIDSTTDSTTDEHAEPTRCDAPISLALIHAILSGEEELENDVLEHSFLAYVWAHPEQYRVCPSQNCCMVYRVDEPGTILHCPGCKKSICSSCHVDIHEGLSCSQYMAL